MRWILSQMGAREHYLAPVSLQRAGQLKLFYTEAWCSQGRNFFQRCNGRLKAFAGRYHSEIPAEKVVSFTPRAIWREALRPRIWGHLPEQGHLEYRSWYAHQVAADLANRELDPELDIFFGYNTECLEILPMLRERGVRIILDQVDPGRVEGELVREEMKRWPGWETNPGWISNEYYDRTEAEWELADTIVVNSEWSKQCLLNRGVPDEKIHVIPLAYEAPFDGRARPPGAPFPLSDNSMRLRVLFLGTVCLRKGIQYLIEAARQLEREPITFTVAGPIHISQEAVHSAPTNVGFTGPINRGQVSDLYREADVYVLPTVSDGFAMTQLEAMAHGLPVITTSHCGNLVTHGTDGLIVPACDSTELADRILQLNGDSGSLKKFGRNARSTFQRFSVQSYGKALIQISSAISCDRATAGRATLV